MNEHTPAAKQGGLAYWKKVVILFCLGWTVIWIYRTVLNPILPEIKVQLGVESDASMGLISSMFFLAYTSMQIPSGFLADKFGRKIMLIPGFLIFAFGAFTVGIAPSLAFLLVGSFLAGLGQGTYYGPAYSISSSAIPNEKRGFSTAIINSGSALGMALGYIGSSYMVKGLGWDWRPLIYVTGALIVIIVIAFAKVIKEKPAENAVEGTKEKDPNDKATMKTLFGDIRMISAYVIYFSVCYGYYMIVTWLPSYLQMERGFQGAAIGFASALVAFASVPGALLFSRLSDKFKHKKIMVVILLQIIAAVTLYLTVAVQNNDLLILFLIMYGFFGKLAVDPIMISYVADIAPKQGYSTTFGVFNFFGMMSSVVAPFVTGLISDATGSKILGFYLAIGIIIVCTAFLFIANLQSTSRSKKVEANEQEFKFSK
ncbi:MFS transporter [Brevibacillus laterosporus]|uniref:MFS transporter n=1 Tax=Brevibacillus laterosporus TaxID=1465 RepID=UPI00264EFEBB|nr:MFS transporter [Brevibacillus laterosporus]MDN9011696.1 MFS transporter [Brevibacillus laterosporus]MDO0942696.1 MFS transporter [Brevibacillus laterosporus]